MSDLRLGFHYHIPAARIDGRIHLPGFLGRFIDSLAESCQSLVCFLHSLQPDEPAILDYPLQSKRVEWVDIGSHASIPMRMLRAGQVKRIVSTWTGRLDVMLIRGPSPLLPDIAAACGSLPVALLLVGDYLAGVDDLPQPAWRKELIRLWSRWNASRQLKVARRSLTFVNSRLLYRQLEPYVPRLVETRTTTLTREDFYVREDTCQSRPIRLLYTGRLTASKGILDMVTALAQLVGQGEDVVLDLVGMIEKGEEGLPGQIRRVAEEIGVGGRVVYHGYRPVGPELFAFYRAADIYVIASQSSFEGFPRTIWEAMANSLPVVATRVGSIPDYVEGAVLLVPPRSPHELMNAIAQIIQDSQLRKNLISIGMRLAKVNTIENRTREMIDCLVEQRESRGT